jgi:hypothetical protein
MGPKGLLTAVEEQKKGLHTGSTSTDGGVEMLVDLTVTSLIVLNIFWWWKR